MRLSTSGERVSPKGRDRFGYLILCGVLVLAMRVAARATENGASVYPVGTETVLPGLTPAPGRTMFCEFTAFYSANEMADGNGKNSVPEFKLRVLANALKVEHAWTAHLWGGTLKSNLAVPMIYQQLRVPAGEFTEFGVGNIAIGVLGVGYHRKNLHWFYEVDAWLPGTGYSRSKVLNIGQHNYALAPVLGFTYLPTRHKLELSSRVQYIVNFRNGDTHYQSGNEFTQEYAVMRGVSQRISIGVNGYYYQQTTDDRLNRARVSGDGRRGRDFAIGPQVRVRLGQLGALAFKYERDTLVQHKPRGSAFWFQIGLPIGGER